MSKKVKAVVRIDDIGNLKIFDKEHKDVTWFCMKKGDSIVFTDNEVIFHTVALDIPIRTDKTAVIGFTPEIAVVGLVDDSLFPEFVSMIAPKQIIVVREFKLRF